MCAEKIIDFFYCNAFKALKPVQRYELVREHKLCENCLMSNHITLMCRKQSVCSVPGCGKKHTKFIHIDDVPRITIAHANPNQVQVNHIVNANSREVCLPVVSVKVNNKADVLALLDTASTSTFCTRDLIENLKVKGSVVKYVLSTLSEVNDAKCSMVVNLSVMSQDGSFLNLSNVFVLDNIPVNQYEVNVSEYDHLYDLPVEKCVNKVDILIGQDNSEALIPLQVKRGKQGEPFAVRTLLGWSINGPTSSGNNVNRRAISHFITTEMIEEKINQLWEIENEGLSISDASMSQEDKRVIELWDKKVRQIGGHYELPIPWKDNVCFPNNIEVAKSRLTPSKLV